MILYYHNIVLCGTSLHIDNSLLNFDMIGELLEERVVFCMII